MGMHLFFSEICKHFLPTKEIFHGAKENSNFVLMTLRGTILSYLHIPERILNYFTSLDGFPPEIPRQMLLLEVIGSWVRNYYKTV